MPVLQVIGDQAGAGKTCLIGGLLSRLAGDGQRLAYCRPFSATPDADPDVAFFSQYLPQVCPGAPAAPVPQPAVGGPRSTGSGAALTDAVGRRVADALARLEADAELVLVEGPDLESGLASALAERLSAVGGRVLLVFRYQPGLTASQVAQAVEPFGPRLAGVVVNGVTRHRQHQVRHGLLAELKAQGVPVLGFLPEDRAMLAVTVQQIADHLGGRYVQEPERTDAWVERFLIGGNIMDSGAIYFGRLPNQAVITRAARPDIQLASLTPNTRCLVLTGGDEPAEYVRVEARQREVPLVLVPGDTLATAEALDGLLDQANPYSQHKLERFAQLMQEHLELRALDPHIR